MGQHVIYFILILNTFFKIIQSFHVSEFMIDYFIQQKFHAVNIVVCNNSDAISTYRNFQERKTPFLSHIHSLEYQKNNHFIENFMSTINVNSLGIFIDSNCETSNPLIKKVLSELVNNCCFNVLFWNQININKEFIEGSVPIGTQLILAKPKDSTVTLYDIAISMKTVPIGFWENGHLLMETHQIDKHELQNHALHGIVSFTDQSIKNISIVKFRNEEISDFELSSLANFSLSIYRCLRIMYGLQWELTSIFNPDKLMNHVDVFLNVSSDSLDFIITSENHIKTISNSIIRLPSIKTIRQCFVFKHPPIYSYKTFYLKPFSFELWTCLGIFLISSAVLLYLMCLLKIEDIDHNELSIFGNVLYCLGALINQGLSVPSNRSSKRFVQFNMLQMCLFISNFYSAIILNYLLYPTQSTIDSIDEIIKEGFEIGYEDTIYNSNTFSVNTSEIFQYNIRNMTGSYNITTGVDKIRKSKFAFLSIDSSIFMKTSEYFTDAEICEISSVPLKNTYELTMYLRRNSPYKELFQKGILLLKETGIINHEDKTWNKRDQKCSSMVKYVQIGLQETSIALEIFILGFICSAFIFILELINVKFMSWTIT